MALATRCPNCQAMFRVVSDQLKLRGGLVRCGGCRHVFDAIGSLSYIDDAALSTPAAPAPFASSTQGPAAAPPVAETLAAPTPPTALDAPSNGDDSAAEPTEAQYEPADTPRSLPEAVAARIGSATTAAVDPLAVPTLLAPSAMERDDTSDPATTSESRSTRRRRAAHADTAPADTASETAEQANATAAAPEAESPDEAHATAAEADAAFLRESRRPRGFSIFFGGGSVVLTVVLLLQTAVLFRTELITRWPQLRPTLVQLCDLYGCSVGWPTRSELLAVVGTELQAIPGTDMLELTAVVRNRASFRVALPAVEITLTDTNNRTVARKVFAPVDYLASSGEPSSRINEGLGAGGDYVVRITFEARGLNAAGFVVYPFYL
jgi:predicted Zn finger-like uncharacterized protein